MVKKQIILNVLSSYAGRGIITGLGFFLVPFLIWKLGQEAFGLIVLMESLMYLSEILSISVRMALARHSTFEISRENHEGYAQFLSTGRFMFIVIALAVLALGMGVGYALPHAFNIPAAHLEHTRNLFIFLVISFVITIPNMVYWAGLYSKQRFDLINACESSGAIFRALALFILFILLPKRHINLSTYGMVFLAMTWLQNTLVYLIHRRINPDVEIRYKHFRFEKVAQIFSLSMFVSLKQIGNTFYNYMINILISVFWGPTQTAIFAISLKFPQMINRFFLEPAYTLAPSMTNFVAKNQKDKLEELMFFYTKILVVSSYPLIVFLYFFARPIILLWVGEEFLLSADLLRVHMIDLIFTMALGLAGGIQLAYGKVKTPSILVIYVTIGKIALILLCVKFSSINLMTIAWIGAVSSLVWSITFVPLHEQNIGNFIKEIFLAADYQTHVLGFCSHRGDLGRIAWFRSGNTVQLASVDLSDFDCPNLCSGDIQMDFG
jgi:O-antigen/teichoic acid export membrane protein